MRLLVPVLLAGIFGLCSLIPASAQAEIPRVYVGVYLHDVSSFEQQDGIFDVDAEIWAKWRGDFDPDAIQIANAGRIERQLLDRESDGSWNSARWRVRGTMRGEFPVHRFPFDEQILAITLELPEHQARLVPDLAGSGMAESFSITDWHYEPEFRPAVSHEIFHSDLGSLAWEGEPATVHRVSFEVAMARPIGPVIVKLFFPLALVAIIVLCALFVHPESIETRVTMGVTGLVACIAFQFSLSDILPEVAYMTMADALFLTVYALSMICVAISVAVHGLHQKGFKKHAIWTDRIMRPMLFVGTAAVVWFSVPEALEPPVLMADPLPEMERTPSAQDTLRIGSNLALRATIGPHMPSINWPLVYNDPDLGPKALLVEHAPGVDNEALRFLATGEVEVTWRLREDIRWSDGKPITSADLMLGYEASPDENIIEASAPDERTFILLWEERRARALESPNIWPAHAVEELFREDGYDAVVAYMREHPIPSTGPYSLTSFDEERLIIEANPYFIGPAPNIERVEILRYPDRESLTKAFSDGGVDIILPNGVTPEDLGRIRRERPDAAHLVPSSIFVFLQPNLDDPLLEQADVRRALLQALDRELLATEVYDNPEQVAHLPTPGPLPSGATVIETNRDQARAEFDRLGMLGETITLNYAPSTLPAFRDRLVKDLESAGLEVALNEVPSTVALRRTGEFEGLLLHLIRSSRQAPTQRWWNLQTVDGRYPPDARNSAYTEEIHQRVQREVRALYPERREQLKDDLFVSWSERLPLLPLVFADERILADPALRGWERPPDKPFGEGMEMWYFVEAE